jgi:hypothetical protein
VLLPYYGQVEGVRYPSAQVTERCLHERFLIALSFSFPADGGELGAFTAGVLLPPSSNEVRNNSAMEIPP